MTLIEVLLAAALTLAVSGAAFSMLPPAQRLVRAQTEAAEMQQRLRVAVDVLTAALLEARAVAPYGENGISITAASGTRRFYLDGHGTLRCRDIDDVDFPVLDNLAGLAFDYVADEHARVFRVRATVRVRAISEPTLPEDVVQFDVTLRNR
jgi:hypothetical protein